MIRSNMITRHDWFDDFFRGLNDVMDTPDTNQLKVDVQNVGDTIVVRADVPGISRDDLNVTIEKGVLTISGSRSKETEKSGDTHYLCERSCGSYSRSFQIPSDIDDKSINATLRDGVLQLILERSPESKMRKIEIG